MFEYCHCCIFNVSLKHLVALADVQLTHLVTYLFYKYFRKKLDGIIFQKVPFSMAGTYYGHWPHLLLSIFAVLKILELM